MCRQVLSGVLDCCDKSSLGEYHYYYCYGYCCCYNASCESKRNVTQIGARLAGNSTTAMESNGQLLVYIGNCGAVTRQSFTRDIGR